MNGEGYTYLRPELLEFFEEPPDGQEKANNGDD